MVSIFIAVKNRYLNPSAVIKFATTQNERKWIFLTISAQPDKFWPLLTEEALFTCSFRRLVLLFKYLQELKVVHQ